MTPSAASDKTIFHIECLLSAHALEKVGTMHASPLQVVSNDHVPAGASPLYGCRYSPCSCPQAAWRPEDSLARRKHAPKVASTITSAFSCMQLSRTSSSPARSSHHNCHWLSGTTALVKWRRTVRPLENNLGSTKRTMAKPFG